MKFITFLILLVSTVFCSHVYANTATVSTAPSISLQAVKGDDAIKYDIKNISNFADALKFKHWSELIIPGAPERGKVLFQWVMYLIVFPLFGILLIWGIIQALGSEGYVDYVDIIKRIFIFVIFTGFSSIIFGYLIGLQRGMSSLVNIALNAEIGVVSKFLNMEDATTQTKMSLALEEAQEKIRSDLLNMGAERVSYKNWQDREVSIPRCGYMIFPLVAYNESLALQDKDSCVVPYDEDDTDEIEKLEELIEADLEKIDDSQKRELLAPFATEYASILTQFPNYPGAQWERQKKSKRSKIESKLQDLYSSSISIPESTRLNVDSDAPLPELIYDLLGGSDYSGLINFYKANVNLLIKNPIVVHDVNLAIWRAYHGSTYDVDGLTISELQKKMTEVRKGENGKVLTITDSELTALKSTIYNIYYERCKQLPLFAPLGDEGEPNMSPSEWNETVSSKWSNFWNTVVGAVKAVAEFGIKAFAYLIDGLAQGLQRLIMWVLIEVMAFILALHFFFTCITSAFIGNKKTEQAFFKNVKVSLIIALVPFVCSLFLSTFNMLMNAFYHSTTGGVSVGAGAIAGVTGLIFLAVVQLVGLCFLTVYSIKATRIVIEGGGVAGAALAAAAGGAVATGAFAAKQAGALMGGPAGSMMAGAASSLGKGLASTTDAMGNMDGDNKSNPGNKALDTVNKGGSKNNVPKPADTTKGSEGANNATPKTPTTPNANQESANTSQKNQNSEDTSGLNNTSKSEPTDAKNATDTPSFIHRMGSAGLQVAKSVAKYTPIGLGDRALFSKAYNNINKARGK